MIFESVQPNPNLLRDIDTFHLKGLRQILKLPTTYGQMENNQSRTMSNKAVYAIANDKVNSWEARDLGNGIFKPIKKLYRLVNTTKIYEEKPSLI